MVDGHRPGRCCRCFWTTLVLGTMFGAAVFVTIDLRDAKPVNRPRGRPASALLDRKLLVASSRTVPRRLPERLNRTLQRSLFFSSRKARNPALPAAHANRPVRTSVVDASDGPLTTGPSTCRAPQSAVCERCVAASRGVPKAAGRALASSGPARGRGQVGHSRSAPQRRCPTSYQWSWNKPLEANDAVRHAASPPIRHLPSAHSSAICPPIHHLPTPPVCRPSHSHFSRATLAGQGNSVPGLRAVRGIAALHEPGVEVVAQWQQSNWPALVRRGDVRVRAVALTMTTP